MAINGQDCATIIGAAGTDEDGVTLYLYSKDESLFPANWYRLADNVDGTLALMAATAAIQAKNTVNIGMVDGKVCLIVCNTA